MRKDKVAKFMKLYDKPVPSLRLFEDIPNKKEEEEEAIIKILQKLGYKKCVRCDGIGCPDCDKLGWKKKKGTER